MNQDLFDVKIISKEGVIFEGKVISLSSYNEKGKFDILHTHANFISLIEKKIEIVKENGEFLELKIDKGLLKNKSNSVEIFT